MDNKIVRALYDDDDTLLKAVVEMKKNNCII